MEKRKIIRINGGGSLPAKRSPLPYVPAGDLDNATQVQNFNRMQIYDKGFDFIATTGAANSFPIQLGGVCRFMYGICLYYPNMNLLDEDTISLEINQEKVIDNVIWWSFNPQGGVGNVYKQTQYFPLPRPLSGADVVKLTVNSVNTHKVYIVFYLSQYPNPNYFL